MNPLLKEFASEQFKTTVGAVSSPKALRRYLVRCKKVGEARRAMSQGLISEEAIRHFADILMEDFIRGIQFPHEIALAVVAVLLESRRTKFAEDYLIDLARLEKISEMHLAPQVAGLCLQEWFKAAKVVVKKANISSNRITSYASKKVQQGKMRQIGLI